MDKVTFWRTIMGHALLGHGGYAKIERATGFAPAALILKDPTTIEPVRNPGGDVVYIEHLEQGGTTTHVWDDMLVIEGLSYDALGAYETVDIGKGSIALGLALRQYSEAFFGNSAEARTVIECENRLDQQTVDMTRKIWNQAHQGIGNAHKVAVLGQGMSVKTLSVTPENAQLIEEVRDQGYC